MEHQVVGYCRVSTEEQDLKNQRLEILEYASRNDLKITTWVEKKVSSSKSNKERLIDVLLERLNEGDMLIVADLSRLGRSVGQIAIIVNTLIETGVALVCIKENIKLNGTPDIQSKVMLTMFSLFAEIERDLISDVTLRPPSLLSCTLHVMKGLEAPTGPFRSDRTPIGTAERNSDKGWLEKKIVQSCS